VRNFKELKGYRYLTIQYFEQEKHGRYETDLTTNWISTRENNPSPIADRYFLLAGAVFHKQLWWKKTSLRSIF